MRLLHLVHQYPPHFIGGTELYTQTLAGHQAQSGHQVSVFCPSPQEVSAEPTEVVVEGDVRIYRVSLGTRSRTKVFRDSFGQQYLKKAFDAVLEGEKPDLVHIQHLMGMPTGLVGSLKAAGIPYLITLHDYWYRCANAQLLTNTDQTICSGPDNLFLNCARCALARSGRPEMGWLAPAVAPLMYFRNNRLDKVLQGAAKIIAPTHFVFRICSELGVPANKMKIIRHGLELPEENLAEAQRVHAGREHDGVLRIGYIGGINWQKGLHILIEAVNKLPADQVQLILYGDLFSFPEYVQQIRQIIRHPRIILAGPIPHEQIWLALADFDVVALPALWYETSSLILDEAFAVGVPVIASRLGVMPEKIDDDVNGRLFPVGDADALSEILANLIENPDTLQRWQAGIPPVRHISEHVQDVEDVYTEALVAI